MNVIRYVMHSIGVVASIYIYTYAYTYMCIYVYIYIYICMYMSICIHIYTYIYIYTYTKLDIYTQRIFFTADCELSQQCSNSERLYFTKMRVQAGLVSDSLIVMGDK